MKRAASLLLAAALLLTALPALADDTPWTPNMGAHPSVIAMLDGTTAADAAQGLPALAQRHGITDPDTLPGLKAQQGYTLVAVAFPTGDGGEVLVYMTLAEFIEVIKGAPEIPYGHGVPIFTGDIMRITEGGTTTYYFYTGSSGELFSDTSIDDFAKQAFPSTILLHQQETLEGLSVGDLYQGSDGVLMYVMKLPDELVSSPLTQAPLFIYPAP